MKPQVSNQLKKQKTINQIPPYKFSHSKSHFTLMRPPQFSCRLFWKIRRSIDHHTINTTWQALETNYWFFFSKKCFREMESVLNYIGEHVDKDKNRNQWMNRVLLKDEWVDGCGVSGCRLHSQFSKANVWIFMLTLVTRAIRCWWHD